MKQKRTRKIETQKEDGGQSTRPPPTWNLKPHNPNGNLCETRSSLTGGRCQTTISITYNGDQTRLYLTAGEK